MGDLITRSDMLAVYTRVSNKTKLKAEIASVKTESNIGGTSSGFFFFAATCSIMIYGNKNYDIT